MSLRGIEIWMAEDTLKEHLASLQIKDCEKRNINFLCVVTDVKERENERKWG